MIDLSDLVRPEAVAEGLAAASKKTLFQQLGALAATAYGIDAKVAAEGLAQREKLGSTGFGGGIAIPHARIEGIDAIHGVFVELARPIDFTATPAPRTSRRWRGCRGCCATPRSSPNCAARGRRMRSISC
jgi:PTS system nitrogen regulatory IIA component